MSKPKYRPRFYCQAPGCSNPLLWKRTTSTRLKRGEGRFCSQKCSGVARSAKRVRKKCEICGKEKWIKPSHAAKGLGRFCSYPCRDIGMSGENAHNWVQRVKKECEVCGLPFEVLPSTHTAGHGRFCSQGCHGLWRSRNQFKKANPGWKGGKTQKTCEICNKPFSIRAYIDTRGDGRFCSNECKGNGKSGINHPGWKPKIKKECHACGKHIELVPSDIPLGRGAFCSLQCRVKTHRGKNHPSWRGGKSFEPYDTNWTESRRKQIRERDGYTCAICGAPDSKHVHHIDYCKTNSLDDDNLITLCQSCHGKTGANREYWRFVLTELMQQRATNHYKVSLLDMEIHWVEENEDQNGTNGQIGVGSGSGLAQTAYKKEQHVVQSDR